MFDFRQNRTIAIMEVDIKKLMDSLSLRHENKGPQIMKQILIVDDERSVCATLARWLEPKGYSVLAAYDAVAGLATAMKNRPDLIVLDVSMPAGSGFSLAESIQKMPDLVGTPFVIITQSERAGLEELATALGASAFFHKPVDETKFVAAVQRTLGDAPQSVVAEPNFTNT
jgi:CheY-like chemotaxis protein